MTGGDQAYIADVVEISGVKRLATDASFAVTVDELLAFDNIADTWTFIDACANTETLTFNIASGPSGPAVSKVVTFTSSDIYVCAEEAVTQLNADSTFKADFKAMIITDNAIVHISSLYVGEFGERPNIADYATTPSGGVTRVDAFDKIVRKQKVISLARDPNDKRIGTIGVSGTVFVLPGSISNRVDAYLLDGSSSDMRVDGSITPVVFSYEATTIDEVITNIKCFGGGNGIKFGQFLSKNSPLTNGIEIEIKSDDEVFTFAVIKTTEAWKNLFASSPEDFRIDVQSGADQFLVNFSPASAFTLRKAGSFATDDYVKATVSDDIDSGLAQLECRVNGFGG
jgi:hypothetical protein